MFQSSVLLWSATWIALALGTKNNLDGCVSTDIPSPTGFCAVWYVPDTGEICSTSEFVAAVPATTSCTTEIPEPTEILTTEPLTTTQTLAVTTIISVLAKTTAAIAVDTTCTTTPVTAAAVVDTTCTTATLTPSFTFKPTNATLPTQLAGNLSTSSLKTVAIPTFFANNTNGTAWSTTPTPAATIPFTYDNSTVSVPTTRPTSTTRPVLASTGGAMKTASSWVGSGSLLAIVALLMAL